MDDLSHLYASDISEGDSETLRRKILELLNVLDEVLTGDQYPSELKTHAKEIRRVFLDSPHKFDDEMLDFIDDLNTSLMQADPDDREALLSEKVSLFEFIADLIIQVLEYYPLTYRELDELINLCRLRIKAEIELLRRTIDDFTPEDGTEH